MNSAVFEITGVARGNGCISGTGDGGDQSIKNRNRASGALSLPHNFREHSCAGLVERQNSSGKIFYKHFLNFFG
ncbi:MAG TPA: hypothetical protein VKT81_14435 [Bryobacteraceae bacterium]|nr:hypothetical protein [Bryobacteraceae bacterium]